MNQVNEQPELILRLRKLEKSQARYRVAFLSTAAIAVLLFITGAGKRMDDLIQAKTFEVVNDEGKVLARLSSASGKGDIRLYRADGNPLVTIGSSTDNSGRVDIFNADGKVALTLATSANNGAGMLIVNTSSGARAVQIGTSSNNQGGVWIYNADQKLIAVMSTASNSSDGLAETYDAAGTRTGHLP